MAAIPQHILLLCFQRRWRAYASLPMTSGIIPVQQHCPGCAVIDCSSCCLVDPERCQLSSIELKQTEQGEHQGRQGVPPQQLSAGGVCKRATAAHQGSPAKSFILHCIWRGI